MLVWLSIVLLKIVFVFCSAPSLVQKSYSYKFYKNESPQFFFKLIPVRSSEYSPKSMLNAPFYKIRHNFLKRFFVLSGIMQWNIINLNLRNSKCLSIFRNSILKFITPSANSIFNSNNSKEIEFITRLAARSESLARTKVQT